MNMFTISLAGIPVGVKPLCSETQLFFTDYLSCETPRFVVAPCERDLEYEQIMFERRNGEYAGLLPGKAYGNEITALLRLIANRIPQYNAILFHGSVLAVDGKAYLFTARSGTGKTTHTRLWLQQLPQAYVLNGDKPFLKVDCGGQILACGTPWRGKEKLGCNEMLPLEAICLLERAKENRICSISVEEASQALLHQVHFPEGPDMIRAIEILNQISRKVPLFRLGCNMEPEAAQVSIRAMIPGILEDAAI